jgi:parallel beta-helix repeat protein
VSSIGSSVEGREIWAVKISDNPDLDEDEAEILFVGCHHAREWIAVEVPYRLAQHLVSNYGSDPEITHLVDNSEIWIVPIVNPDGLEYSRTADRLWRKNRRDNGDGTFGVDLSRNYSVAWGLPGSSSDTSDPLYRGPHAFSEPETQAIRDLALGRNFQTFVSYHSYGQLILYPWGYTKEPIPDYCLISSMAQDMAELIEGVHGQEYVPKQAMDLYPISGGEIDWFYGELGIPAFAIELRPATLELGGFVLAEDQIVPTFEENLPAALHMISWSIGYGLVENVTTGQTYSHIQSAICAAADGDEIVILAGAFHESIDFKGKSIVLRSANPDDPAVVTATVIHGDPPGRTESAVAFRSGEDANSVLAGLTIAGAGYGVSCAEAHPTIEKCEIRDNDTTGIWLWGGSNPSILNCVIADNRGPGIRAEPKSTGRVIYYNYPQISNCTIARNRSHGIVGGRPTITSCIIFDNDSEGAGVQIQGGSFTVSYSNIQGGWPGEGNMNADPLFADPDNGGPQGPSQRDYRLKSHTGRWDPDSQSWVQDIVTSPCIDKGNPAAGWTAELWPHGGRINMGAFGGTPQASMSRWITGNLADLNNDGAVNFTDLSMFTDVWLTEDALVAADLNRDGSVDLYDLAQFGKNMVEPDE